MSNIPYLIHIPKTGGTSLRAWFHKTFGSQNIYDSWEITDIFNINPEKFNNLSAILSHSGLIYTPFIDKPIDFVLILRNPIEVTLSFYEELKKDQIHPIGEKARRLSSDEFLIDEGFINKFANVYSRHLSTTGIDDLENLYHGDEYYSITARDTKLTKWIKNITTNLPYIKYIKKFDDLRKITDSIATDFSLYPHEISHLNKSKFQIEKYEKYFDAIRSANEIDFKLHQYLNEQQLANEKFNLLSTIFEKKSIKHPHYLCYLNILEADGIV